MPTNVTRKLNRTRVKICGITRPEDALVAAYAGADAIGLVFYEKSPRHVTTGMARAIVAAIPPFITTVGLFVDADTDQIRSVLDDVSIDILQFHGNEAEGQCQQFGRPYIKAFRVKREQGDLGCLFSQYPSASAFLLDTFSEKSPGGTGLVFDWSIIPPIRDKPIILAGGLTADNVASAIAKVRPYAVDVSGGVETGKGIKDAGKITAFMKEVAIGQNESGYDD